MRSTIPRRAATGLLLAAGVLLATAGPAAATVDTNRTDRPKMEGPNRDFGNNQFLGSPLNGGIVNWDVSANGVITPWVSGQLYLNNLSGTCTHIKVVYHDAAHNELATRTSTSQCVTDNRSYQSTVSISSYGSTAVDHVVLQMKDSADVTVNSVVEYY
jgi:hypothetical protein